MLIELRLTNSKRANITMMDYECFEEPIARLYKMDKVHPNKLNHKI